MERYFVPFSIAATLKEIGFDEECLYNYSEVYGFVSNINGLKHSDGNNRFISAPLYDQAIDWFIEKYSFCIYAFRYKKEWTWKIDDDFGILEVSKYELRFPNRYEALNAGILKAVELVKQKV